MAIGSSETNKDKVVCLSVPGGKRPIARLHFHSLCSSSELQSTQLCAGSQLIFKVEIDLDAWANGIRSPPNPWFLDIPGLVGPGALLIISPLLPSRQSPSSSRQLNKRQLASPPVSLFSPCTFNCASKGCTTIDSGFPSSPSPPSPSIHPQPPRPCDRSPPCECFFRFGCNELEKESNFVSPSCHQIDCGGTMSLSIG